MHDPRFRRFAKRCLLAAAGLLFGVHLWLPFAGRAQSPEELQIVIPPGPGTPVIVAGNVYQEIKNKTSSVFHTMVTGGMVALMNAAQVFTQRIAYDLAQRILTGDAGQYPMFWEDGFDTYLGNVAKSSAEQFVDSINTEIFFRFGFDLCEPIDPFQLQLSLGLGRGPEQLQADCSFARISSAFEQTRDAFASNKDVFDVISASFDPNASELSVGIGYHVAFLDAQYQSARSAQLDRQETQGLKQVQDFISGKITTPATEVRNTLSEGNIVKMLREGTYTTYGALLDNAYRIGFTQLGILTASTFVNTLLFGALDKLFKGYTSESAFLVDLHSAESANNRNVARARIVFSDLLTPNLFTSDQRDFVTELSTCPNPRGLFNCAMDEAFAAALRTVGQDGAYTVGQASHVVLNGEPPKNPAFLHKDWELIPDSDTMNSDPSCYQRAYCASNLAKMRYARLLPVGWEMAANSPYNKKRNGKYITLEEAMRGFNVCNAKGEADPEHPWCKLIDPNWVLSAPPHLCRVKGHGDTVFDGTSLRVQECADVVSCLQRDDRGRCIGGYGFCVAEKPVWRFNGDQCLERFASCRTYQTRGGERVSYLRNTIDYGNCSADNIGCMWFSSRRLGSDPEGASWDASARVYFDSTVKTCSSAADGCTSLLEVRAGQSALNLIQNPSFEESPVQNEQPLPELVAWNLSTPYQAPEAEGAVAVDGARSLKREPGDGTATSRMFELVAVRNYTLSAYVRAVDDSVSANYDARLHLLNGNQQPVASGPFYRSNGCTVNQLNMVGAEGTITSADWSRVQCTFVANTSTQFAYVTLEGANVLFDGLQLEETEFATDFVDGVASGLAERHLKVPPAEFNCTGQPGDHAACSSYAKVCRQADAGCQGYRDVNNPSAPEIPATLSGVDFCPTSCVGYAEYRKQPSTFDLGQNVDERLNDPQDDTVAHFVPTFAQQCSLQDVGCEEFTNVEAAAQGGEEKAYFNYVRACEKPGANTETYFTWEGSDTTGYQLRTWSLINDPGSTPRPPKIVQKAGPDGILKNPGSCNAQSWQSGDDADCRQIFNADGDVFYAYFSQTVASSPSCIDFRKNNSNVADCGKTGGSYSAGSGECIYSILPEESRSCSAAAAGCRAYVGVTGRNTAIVFEETFRSGTTTTAFTAGDLSNESILVGDQSLKVTGNGSLATATVFPSAANQLYTVSFWAKTTSPDQADVSLQINGSTVAEFPMQVDWRRYEFGPFAAGANATSVIAWVDLPNATFIDEIRIERLLDVSYVVKDSWVVPDICDRTPEGLPQPQAMLGCREYEDRDGNNVTVRRFGHLCREDVISCKAFVDTRNTETPYDQSFTITGNEVNLKTTDEAKAWEDKYIGSWSTTSSADRYIYLIDTPDARCEADQAGCRAFGKPKLDQTTLEPKDQAKDYDPVYFIDNPSAYLTSDGEPNQLCRKDELFCEEFKSGRVVAYFRNPMTHACEWKDKVLLKANPGQGIPNDGEYTGWFKTGTSEPCYPNVLSSGNTYLIQNSGDPGYTGWVGTCPVEQSECTEFRDPKDTSDPTHPSGKPYFFIKNQRLDLTSCNGEVDLTSGCVLFRDMSDVRERYSSVATYAKSKAEDDTPQQPIDCTTDPNNPFCTSSKCVNPIYTCEDSGWCSGVALACALSGHSLGECQFALLFPCTEQDPTSLSCLLKKNLDPYIKAEQMFTGKQSCTTNADCSVDAGQVSAVGTCQQFPNKNDSNVVMKVRLDRDCAKWLGCSTAETVYDPVQQKYVEQCVEVALCDQSKGANAGSFCANYVDRSREAVLKPGVFFDSQAYTQRPTGFGQPDYSGYSIPNQFQAADLQNRKVATELFANDQALAARFERDYRLVAVIEEQTGLVEFQTTKDALYPQLNICTHTQTGRKGFYQPGSVGKRVCYLAISALNERSTDLVQLPNEQKNDPRNIQTLSDIFRQSRDPLNDIVLQAAFPPAECKANPEGDSPFPNFYVKEWNFEKMPFDPTQVAPGYDKVNLCEYGEDCACSYRKVSYGNQVTQYYSPFGSPPPGGICQGGARDGQTCVPSETVGDGPTNEGTSTGDVGCPGGGRCLAISDVVLVRGQFGQCLQRDYSRFVAGDPARHPCLIWNPNPILSGTYDAAHYVPTAGYTPPVNAGEYYCLSNASPSFETVWTARSYTKLNDSRLPTNGPGSDTTSDGGNDFFYVPGKLAKFNYDRGYIGGYCSEDHSDICDGTIEGACTCWDGRDGAKNRDLSEFLTYLKKNDPDKYEDCFEDPMECAEDMRLVNLGQGIDAIAPFQDNHQGVQALRCMLATTADLDEGIGTSGAPGTADHFFAGIGHADEHPDADYNRGRWIQTGRGVGRTYMEYFVAAKPRGMAEWLNPEIDFETLANENKTEYDLMLEEAGLERNFAQFRFEPVLDPYAAACSLPPEYADSVKPGSVNWSDQQSVTRASQQVYNELMKNFDGKLDRSKENILVDKNGLPLKETCSGMNSDQKQFGWAGEDGRCYYKYWEANYRLDGSPTFEWLNSVSGQSFFERKNDFYAHERTCSKSGFAIRAMFELANENQNNLSEYDVTPSQLTGPWRFVGFWITSCMVGHNDESFLYLRLRVKHADICRELGQVVAPHTRESAAFADRVWANGTFILPLLGLNYGSEYVPFGSALATGVPGKEPLFQTGEPVEDFSTLRPPTFLGSGASYATTRISPLQRWSHLTNIFARVYRVYRYQDEAIGKYDGMCFNGPNHGAACPRDDQQKAADICGGIGECDVKTTSIQLKNSVYRCNALSGVNAGLECGAGFAKGTLDPVCHNAAMKRNPVTNVYEPQLTACELRPGWVQCDNGMFAKAGQCGNNGTAYGAAIAHESHNAFGCGSAAVVPNAGCSKPEPASKDCPLKVEGLTCIEDDFGPLKGHCSGGYDHARCATNSDCVFTAAQWWGAYDDGKLDSTNDKFYLGSPANRNIPGATLYPLDGSPPLKDNQGRSMGPLPFALNQGTAWGEPVQQMSQIRRQYGNDTINMPAFMLHLVYGAVAWPFAKGTSPLATHWPAPHGAGASNSPLRDEFAIPGLCEGAFGALQDPQGTEGSNYSKQKYGDQDRYGERAPYALYAGICRDGINEGSFCSNRSDITGANWPHANTCQPPASVTPGACQVVTVVSGSVETPASGCVLPDGVGDPNSNDPDKDNNACTRSAGYHPRGDLCGTGDNQKCLIGYGLGFGQDISLNQSLAPAPTDVTSGLHTPSFLGFSKPNTYDEAHIAFYAPRPPMIAAPDLSRTCLGPGQCPISQIGRFSIEQQSEGPVSFAGGKAQVAMRFYGWASHEQTPLKAVYVDWGDGSIVQIEDVRLKNKKPYCGVTRECELVPGLTCNSDADCPPAAGKCSDRGSCLQNPTRSCFRDSDCHVGSNTSDRCAIREFFGNSNDACEQNFFEFSHAYACDPSRLPSCVSQNRCASRPDQVCSTNSDCGFGDACVPGLAPPSLSDGSAGGCFDQEQQVCRFTPRLMLVDNWNWCTGECRAGGIVGNSLVDSATAKVRHVYGGCWDGTETKLNTDLTQSVMYDDSNECRLDLQADPESNVNIRPWIVYPGAIQVGAVK